MEATETVQATRVCPTCGLELRFVRHVQGGRKQQLSLWMCPSKSEEHRHFYAWVGKGPDF